MNMRTTDTEYLDYLNGYSIHPLNLKPYQKCIECGFYAWKTEIFDSLCPRCVINLSEFILEISFGISTSKKYKNIVEWSKNMSGYSEQNINGNLRHVIKFHNLDIYNIERIESLIFDVVMFTVFEWTSFKMTLNNKPLTKNMLYGINNILNKISNK